MKLILIPLSVVLLCVGAVLFYRAHFPPRFNPADWFEEAYPDQKASHDLLAVGLTRTSNSQDRAINNLSIRLARHSDDLISITFSAIHDQTFFFRRDVVSALQKQAASFRELRRRVAVE